MPESTERMAPPVPPRELPARARVVVIGGGVIGTSLAYHLGHAGCTDVVVLERDRLTSGTTWHAAGLMTCFGSTNETSTRMRLHTRDLLSRLEAETGRSTGFRPVGVIEAVSDEDRLEEYRRAAVFQRRFGLEVHEIGPREVAERFPLARTDDLLCGFFVPGDGRVNPVDLTMSYARGAARLGVRIVEGVSVTDVVTARGAVTGVRTTAGDIEAETVVNCAGMWARELGERSGLVIPNQSAEHYYLLTDTIDGLDPDAPVLEDPASCGYYREEGGGLMIGLFETDAREWRPEGIPPGFSFGTIPPDWDRMAPVIDLALCRVPAVRDVGIRTLFCGPESFTPDHQPVVGEAMGLHGYFVAAGLNSIGVLTSGGIGRTLAHWITTGRPDVDVSAIAADRFHHYQLTRRYRVERTREIIGTTYTSAAPGGQLTSGRDLKRTPLHPEHAALGASFGLCSGWEIPQWYAGPGRSPQPSTGWGRQPWFRHWETEHRAVREAVGLADRTHLARFVVQGPDAGRLLDRLSSRPVDTERGSATRVLWLAPDGTLDADVLVVKLSGEIFHIIADDRSHAHVLSVLRRSVGDLRVGVTGMTSGYSMLGVHGPRAVEFVSAADPGAVVPPGSAGWIDVGAARVIAVGLGDGSLGEPGFDILTPTEMTHHVHGVLAETGEALGLRHIGTRAWDSLRIEAGSALFGTDIDNTDTVVTAGLAHLVDPEHGFVGREATLAAIEAGAPTRRVVPVRLLDPEPLLFGAEVLLRDGVACGHLRSAAYGWSVRGAVGLAKVEAPGGAEWPDWIESGTWTVDVAGTEHAAEVTTPA